jgi:integrase
MVPREYWYSDDLRMNLASRLDDPRAVIQTMTVTQLTRKEPDAAIYKTPPGYRRVVRSHLLDGSLRRTCARLCHSAGGELEQIQFLLGHRSVETTERYLAPGSGSCTP